MNPHNSLSRLVPKGEIGPWHCDYCGAEGLHEELVLKDCGYEYPPCKWCGETPLCAEDCVGIMMAFSDPNVFVVER